MNKHLKILDQNQIKVTINRLCQQLIENHNDFSQTVLVGIQPRGIFLTNRIIDKINHSLKSKKVLNGVLDISFYRDDLRRREAPIEPNEMKMNISIEEKRVVLIDDVLFTGRSVRSAIDALMTFGRPKSVELLVLVNRRFNRHFPIQPDYIGRTVDVLESERILVEWKEITNEDRVVIKHKTI
tara:strand:- start:126 stop:674 length:549 start_codon:yes stop_codon:yes gene_type:complete